MDWEFKEKINNWNKQENHYLADALETFGWEFLEDYYARINNYDDMPDLYDQRWIKDFEAYCEDLVEEGEGPPKVIKESPNGIYVVKNYSVFYDENYHVLDEEEVRQYFGYAIPEQEFGKWATKYHINIDYSSFIYFIYNPNDVIK